MTIERQCSGCNFGKASLDNIPILLCKLKDVDNRLACTAARLPPTPFIIGRKVSTEGYLIATLLMIIPTPLDINIESRMGAQPCRTAGLRGVTVIVTSND